MAVRGRGERQQGQEPERRGAHAAAPAQSHQACCAPSTLSQCASHWCGQPSRSSPHSLTPPLIQPVSPPPFLPAVATCRHALVSHSGVSGDRSVPAMDPAVRDCGAEDPGPKGLPRIGRCGAGPLSIWLRHCEGLHGVAPQIARSSRCPAGRERQAEQLLGVPPACQPERARVGLVPVFHASSNTYNHHPCVVIWHTRLGSA